MNCYIINEQGNPCVLIFIIAVDIPLLTNKDIFGNLFPYLEVYIMSIKQQIISVIENMTEAELLILYQFVIRLHRPSRN